MCVYVGSTFETSYGEPRAVTRDYVLSFNEKEVEDKLGFLKHKIVKICESDGLKILSKINF